MGHALHDLARHHGWATAQVLEYCRGLDEPTLHTTVPGTYGTILETLRHLIDAEASYLYRLTGAWSTHPWRGDAAVGLDVLAERAATLAADWERFLAGEVDTERLGEGWGDAGEVFAIRASIFIAQALHHANEHRAQIARSSARWGTSCPTSRPGATPWPRGG